MIIGIGGSSNSGKSALAETLASYFKLHNKKVVIFCQDDYTFPTPEIPKINGHTDWEIPESIDFDKLIDTVKSELSKNDIVIVEGHLIYSSPVLNKTFDKRIFVNIDKDTFFKRKRLDLRWGKEPEWYINHIWESFLKYGQPPDNDIIFVDGTKEFDIQRIVSRLGME